MTAENNSFDAHPEVYVPLNENDGIVFGHYHGGEGMSADEMRHRIADQHGADPADVAITDFETGRVSRAPEGEGSRRSRSFGFSKWGANWEPTGPQGDPSLN